MDDIQHMAKIVHIRNMPESVHRVLKSRAAKAGISLSEYLLRELKETTKYPTVEELRARLRKRQPVPSPISAAEIIREERDSR